MTLEEQHKVLIKKWEICRNEMYSINYNFTNATNTDMMLWCESKVFQIDLVFKQPITKENIVRLGILIENAHQTMFFDAIALGKK